MLFLYYCLVAGEESSLNVTGKVELCGSNCSSKTLFTWVLVAG